MHINTDINAIVNKAKKQRADYIGEKLQGGTLPLAVVLAAAVSIAFLSFTSGPTSDDSAAQAPIVELGSHNG
jgi:hypothetical protein